jgi:hypothetical protein
VTPADGSSYRTTDRPPGPPLRSDNAASFVFLCFSSALWKMVDLGVHSALNLYERRNVSTDADLGDTTRASSNKPQHPEIRIFTLSTKRNQEKLILLSLIFLLPSQNVVKIVWIWFSDRKKKISRSVYVTRLGKSSLE